MKGYQQNIAEHILLFRQINHLNQEQFAGLAGLSVTQLRHIEHGRANPTLDTLALIADTLGLSVVDILSPYDPVDTKIHFLLQGLGIPAHLRGYQYLSAILKYLLETDTDPQAVSLPLLYQYLASQEDSDAAKIDLHLIFATKDWRRALREQQSPSGNQPREHDTIAEVLALMLQMLKK